MSLSGNFVGTVTFDIDCVDNLPEKCDPYVLISTGGNKVQTKHLNDCTNSASYSQTLSLSLKGSEDYFTFDVMDYDRWTKDDLVATSGRIHVRQVLEQWAGTGDYLWINLDVKDHDPVKLRCKISFQPK